MIRHEIEELLLDYSIDLMLEKDSEERKDHIQRTLARFASELLMGMADIGREYPRRHQDALVEQAHALWAWEPPPQLDPDECPF